MTKKLFDNFIMFVILISSISLASEDPVNEDSPRNWYLGIADYFFTAIFTFEVCLKVRLDILNLIMVFWTYGQARLDTTEKTSNSVSHYFPHVTFMQNILFIITVKCKYGRDGSSKIHYNLAVGAGGSLKKFKPYKF